MGVDYSNCNLCNEIFCDVGEFWFCEKCGIEWCSRECAEEEGFIFEVDNGKELHHTDNCGHCRGEIEEVITITKSEYERLIEMSEKFSCLEACGVDNWCGYGDAMEMYESDEE